MELVRRMRQMISNRWLDQVGAGNRRRDEAVIQELGLGRYFAGAYGTTGVSGGDIAFLHDYIRANRPQRVIEFGTGKSTWIIAKCMERYCWDHYRGNITLVSMEESQYWFEEQKRYFPTQEIVHFDDFVQITLSEVTDYAFRFITGKSYIKTPLQHFDLCFVDGPNANDTCNMDFIKILAHGKESMSAIIDNRKTTQMAYALLLGKDKCRRYHNGLCVIRDVTQGDLAKIHYGSIFPERMSILRL